MRLDLQMVEVGSMKASDHFPGSRLSCGSFSPSEYPLSRSFGKSSRREAVTSNRGSAQLVITWNLH